MIKSLKYIAVIGALGIGSAVATLPASAQLGLGVGVDTDVKVGVRTSAPPPERAHAHGHYTYDGYESDRWYARNEVRRAHRYDARYNGYDCYESFQYGWENGERVRYDTTFCYDDHDRRYEPQGVRASVRIH
ncbi:MAG: hypothetical protein V7651_00635 [Hyphomonas oceanitis]|uniref:Uncharacterized protein n=1 Tax=Hyphomonas oceanitis SCH89 TaxID=1280953 RepID=A0A059GBI9_9PROT|nr:hypothetical protein [Hyphomonas oceanitis]KDA03838.1 hypothetical protein HOC_03143 [Hyphomonas oceanitis SCH89]